MNETDRVLLVERAMPITSKLALDHFVRINPHNQGIQWADVIAILNDSDAHLDITEPIYEELENDLAPELRPFITLVTFTLLYANQAKPTAERVSAWITLTDWTALHKAMDREYRERMEAVSQEIGINVVREDDES